MSALQAINIRSAQGAYDVHFEQDFGKVIDHIGQCTAPFIVVDKLVAELYPDRVAALQRFPLLTIEATETNKTLAGVEDVCTFLQRNDATKSATVVAIGGGIIQDISTFAAHIYYRGIPYLYVPTTLLSMSDSCVGAKCALNLGGAKNQIGFFQSPKRVIVVDDFLTTLSDEQIRSGYGEIVKLALIGSSTDFDYLVGLMDVHGLRSSELPEIMASALRTKQAIIEIDEYETGQRKTLNYGHTFGHALESVTDHAVPHGLAVAWGIDLANWVSVTKGRMQPAVYRRIHDFLKRHFAMSVDLSVSAGQLLDKIRRDKKTAAGSVALILLSAPGDIAIVPTPIDGLLESAIVNYLEGDNLFRLQSVVSC